MFTIKALKPIDFTDDKKVVHPLRVSDLLLLDDSYHNHWFIVDLLKTQGIEIVEDKIPEPDPEENIDKEFGKQIETERKTWADIGDTKWEPAQKPEQEPDKPKAPKRRGKDGRFHPEN